MSFNVFRRGGERQAWVCGLQAAPLPPMALLAPMAPWGSWGQTASWGFLLSLAPGLGTAGPHILTLADSAHMSSCL